MEKVIYRWLNESDVDKLADIDRSEHLTRIYRQEGSQLAYSAVDWDVPTWTPEGHGEHSLSHIIDFCSEHLERGGLMRGALIAGQLVGAGILLPKIRPNLDQLAALYVSRPYRRLGIASEICRDLFRKALTTGAERIYVSATPSESAVKFYIGHGFNLVDEPIPELFALEPEDIHMIKNLDGSNTLRNLLDA